MFAISERARQVFDDLNHFVDQRVRPAEIVFREQMKDASVACGTCSCRSGSVAPASPMSSTRRWPSGWGATS